MTNKPFYFQGAIACAFFITCITFIGYDCLIERRQRKMMFSVERSNAIVNSLFPPNVLDRLYKHAEIDNDGETGSSSTFLIHTPKLRLKTFLTRAEPPKTVDQDDEHSEPIADLFPIEVNDMIITWIWCLNVQLIIYRVWIYSNIMSDFNTLST